MSQQTLLDELHSRSEELSRHAQAALLKLTALKAGADDMGAGGADSAGAFSAAMAAGRLDRESQLYRAELVRAARFGSILSAAAEHRAARSSFYPSLHSVAPLQRHSSTGQQHWTAALDSTLRHCPEALSRMKIHPTLLWSRFCCVQDANLDLNPALAELMFARHVMNKLESHVFALKEEDAMKAAEFAAAHQDVTSTRAEMEELLDSHQGVVHKMKTLQEKARTINESLQVHTPPHPLYHFKTLLRGKLHRYLLGVETLCDLRCN